MHVVERDHDRLAIDLETADLGEEIDARRQCLRWGGSPSHDIGETPGQDAVRAHHQLMEQREGSILLTLVGRGEEDVRLVSQAGQEGPQQGGLANPGIALDQDRERSALHRARIG
jgi:hypothetical protein